MTGILLLVRLILWLSPDREELERGIDWLSGDDDDSLTDRRVA